MSETVEVKIYVAPGESVTVSGTKERVEKHLQFIEAHRDLETRPSSRMSMRPPQTNENVRWYERGYREGSHRGIEIAQTAITRCLTPPIMVMGRCAKCGYIPDLPDLPDVTVQQTSGPQCKVCGAFTTQARVDSHGMCMKCEHENRG